MRLYKYRDKHKDISHQKFGKLTALYRLHNYHKKRTYWLCVCDCGNLKEVELSKLLNGGTKSCGCLYKGGNNKTHKKRNTKLYTVWANIKQRCYNTNNVNYKDYGGRGIAVCNEWKYNFQEFYNWATKNGYNDTLTIDRIDVNGNYEPTNCRWVDRKQQANNRRNNIIIGYDKYNYNISQWASILNISRSTLVNRYHKNYDVVDMLTKRQDDNTLYPHQVKTLASLYTYNKCAMFLDMGLGKSATGAVKATSYHKPVLIICPKSVIPQWEECFTNWCKDYTMYNLTNKKQLQAFMNDNQDLKMGVINYESAWRKPELIKLKNYTLILDESQAISNSTSKQSKGICKLKFDNLILLSGTPCSNARYDKLYTQLKLLGLNMNKRSYEDRYCNFFNMEKGGVKFRVLSRSSPYKNVDELKSKMRDLGCVFMKTDEVIELPKQRFINVWVQPSKYYKTFVKDGYVDCGDTEYISSNPATDMLYLRQLCNSNEKIEMVRTLIESTEDRLIIFYNFNSELELLVQLVSKLKRPISFINGSEKNLNCYHNESNSVTLVQFQSGSSGVNLQKANKIIYYSPPIKSDFYEQSKKRTHRIGQNEPCCYWKLITTNSIEQKIYNTLNLKCDYTEELFKHD